MRLRVLMKSGNNIDLRCVKDYKITYQGNEIVGLRIEQRPWQRFIGKRLLLPSVDLSQIEAITIG